MLGLIPDCGNGIAYGQPSRAVECKLQPKRSRDARLKRLSRGEERAGPFHHHLRGAGDSPGLDIALDEISPADCRVAADVLCMLRQLQADADVVGKLLRTR